MNGLVWIYLNDSWLLKRERDGAIVESVVQAEPQTDLWRWGGQTYHLAENAKRAAQQHAENPPSKGRS